MVYPIRLCRTLFLWRSSKAISYLRSYEQIRSAGHAKWQNIKSVKQSTDAAKSKLISRYVASVKKAILAGGMQTNPRLNTKLGDVLAEAAKFNVPKATLERAIARAQNMKITAANVEIQGPGGCSIVVRCETENISSFRRDLKKALRGHDSVILANDSILNMFRSQGFIRAATKTKDGRDVNEEYAEEAAIIANAESVCLECVENATDENLAKNWLFITDQQSMNVCRSELEKLGLNIISTDLDLVAYRAVNFGPGVYEKLEKVLQVLREQEQIVDIFHNVAPPDE